MKRSAAVAFAVAFLASLSLPAHAAPKYKIRWLIGHPNLDYFEEAAQQFKTSVEKGSNGEISVEIVSAESDGKTAAAVRPEGEIAAAVAAGEAEMGHSFTDVIGAQDPKFLAFNAPYLFRDYAHLEGVLEGEEGRRLLAGLSSRDMVGLSFTFSGGASGVAAHDREIRRPEDLAGLKVGFYGDAVTEAWLKSLGAVPVALPHQTEKLGDGYRGKIDAIVITWRNFDRAELQSRFNFMNLVGSSYLVSVSYVNRKFFESLPEAHRKLIAQASREAGRIERAKTIELNQDAKRRMLAKGTREIQLTADGRAAFTKAAEPVYASTLDGLLGKDLLARLRKTADGPALPQVAEVLGKTATPQ